MSVCPQSSHFARRQLSSGSGNQEAGMGHQPDSLPRALSIKLLLLLRIAGAVQLWAVSTVSRLLSVDGMGPGINMGRGGKDRICH